MHTTAMHTHARAPRDTHTYIHHHIVIPARTAASSRRMHVVPSLCETSVAAFLYRILRCIWCTHVCVHTLFMYTNRLYLQRCTIADLYIDYIIRVAMYVQCMYIVHINGLKTMINYRSIVIAHLLRIRTLCM